VISRSTAYDIWTIYGEKSLRDFLSREAIRTYVRAYLDADMKYSDSGVEYGNNATSRDIGALSLLPDPQSGRTEDSPDLIGE